MWSALFLAALAQPRAQQPPSPTFKAEIAYVEVSARVLDARGNFVANLAEGDFEILEDGKPQAIREFNLIRLPVDPRPSTALVDTDDVASNEHAAAGRLFVLALDDLHTDVLRSERVKQVARTFIEEKLGIHDLAAVTVIGNDAATQQFTSNRALLLSTVEMFVGQQPRSSTLEKTNNYNELVGAGLLNAGGDLSDHYIQERRSNDRRTLRSLSRLSDWMGGIRGRRKALVYVGEGIGYDLRDALRALNGADLVMKPNVMEIYSDTREVVAAAARGDVNIYTIDPRGVGAGSDVLIDLASQADASPPQDLTALTDGGAPSSAFRPDLGALSLNRELQASQDNLRMLAEQTAGFAVLNTNDFSTAFARILDENSNYYRLGYYSTNDRRNGKFRTVEVHVRNQTRLVVKAMKGYVAPGGKTNAAAVTNIASANAPALLRDLLQSPISVSGVQLSATVSSFRGVVRANTVAVSVEIRAGDIKLVEKNGTFNGALSLVVRAVDNSGAVRASTSPTVNVALRPETYHRIAGDSKFRFVSQLDLPTGRYQLQAAVLDGVTNKRGSVYYAFEVPDFSKPSLLLSSLALTSDRTSEFPTVIDKQSKSTLPAPTATREFSAADTIQLYAEVYDNVAAPPHRVDVATRIQSAGGETVFTNVQQRSSDEFRHAGVVFQVPLEHLSPGSYILILEARSSRAGTAPVTRSLSFSVR